MKQSIKDLGYYSVETQDKTEGKITDFLFDEKQWVIRYIEADFGSLFQSKKVLIPRAFLDKPDAQAKKFPVNLSNSEIEKCPELDKHLPVSRKYEEELSRHYRINPYWNVAYMGSAIAYYPPRPVHIPDKIVTEQDVDTILRSFNEVQGYRIQAIEGKIGHINDILVDDDDWQIVYTIVDTSNWIPWSKHVIIPVSYLANINYAKNEVEIKLKTEDIKNAPEYNAKDPISEPFEKGLHDFYSQSLVK